MSKMSELSTVVSELKRCGEILIGVSDTLAAMFNSDAEKDTTVFKKETAPAKPREITLEQVRAVLADKSRDGHTAEVRALLVKHGAEKLSEIDSKKYASLLKEAEVLGNG